MKITIRNMISTSIMTFNDVETFERTIKAIDNCIEGSTKYITYNTPHMTTKYSSDYLRNSLIEIERK